MRLGANTTVATVTGAVMAGVSEAEVDLEDVEVIEVGGVTVGGGKKIFLGLGLFFMHYERGVRTEQKCVYYIYGVVVQVRLSPSSAILEYSDSR